MRTTTRASLYSIVPALMIWGALFYLGRPWTPIGAVTMGASIGTFVSMTIYQWLRQRSQESVHDRP